MPISFKSLGASTKQKKIALFKSTGSWTAPAGVTYAIANIMAGGGGGGGSEASGGYGGTSSAFGIDALGANGGTYGNFNMGGAQAAQANTGNGGGSVRNGPPNQGYIQAASTAFSSNILLGGSAVTPGTSYTITVGGGGSGGLAGGANGGSGYVAIEYYE
jgi:hypothetical protein